MSEEITSNSWGNRIKDAFIGILIGLALIVGSVVLIFWNESHSLHMAQSLAQTQKELVTVPTTSISSQNNLKVIFFYWPGSD
jgi:hypothetical protein